MASVKRRLVYVAEEDEGIILPRDSDTSPARPSRASQLHISPSNSVSSSQSTYTNAGSPRVSHEVHLGKGIAHKLVDPLLLVSYDGFLFADSSGTLRTPRTMAQTRLLSCALEDCRSFLKLLLSAEESSESGDEAVVAAIKRQRSQRSRSRSCASQYHKHRRYGSDSSSGTLNSSSTYCESQDSDNDSDDEDDRASRTQRKTRTNRCGRYRQTSSQPSATTTAQCGKGVSAVRTSSPPPSLPSTQTDAVAVTNAGATQSQHEGAQTRVSQTNSGARPDIRNTTVAVIRQQLRGYGLSTIGNKSILWRRLRNHELRIKNRKPAASAAAEAASQEISAAAVATVTEQRPSQGGPQEQEDVRASARHSAQMQHSRHQRSSSEVRYSRGEMTRRSGVRCRPDSDDTHHRASSSVYAAPQPARKSSSLLLPASLCVPMGRRSSTEVLFFSTPQHRPSHGANAQEQQQEDDDDDTTVPLSRASSSMSNVGSTVSEHGEDNDERVQQQQQQLAAGNDEHSQRPSSDSATSPSQRSSGRLWQALVHVGSRLFGGHSQNSQQEQGTSDATSTATAAAAAASTRDASKANKYDRKHMLANRISLPGLEGRNSQHN